MSLLSTIKSLLDYLKSHDIEISGADIVKAIKYLRYFGYLAKDKELNLNEVIEAIIKFQEFFHLEQDGILGPKTYRAMERPRCSVPDFMERTEEARWKNTNLKYYVKNRDSDLSRSDWDNIIQQAWNQWMAVANVTVNPTNDVNNANIIIDIGSGQSDNFDGPSGTLAWAYLPNGRDGQLLCKFDSAETWVADKTKRGILLLNVACHEFGHLLGLEHSKVESALMAPYYSANIEKPQANDDISRIVNLYGKPVSTPTPTPTPTPNPEKITIILEGKVTIPGWRLTPIT